MDLAGPLLGLLLLGLLLAIPILAISAFLRVRRLERKASGAAPEESGATARVGVLEERLAEWEARWRSLEQRLWAVEEQSRGVAPPAPAKAPAPVTPKPPPPAVPAAPPLQPVAPAPTAARPRPTGLDLETLIAGRWLNRIGILALLLAVAFFLKYAFDNDWVGERGRVAIGLLCGSGLLVYSEWLRRRGYRYFSEGIAGLGAGVLYLSLYAGWSFYHLFPQAAAFAGMVVVTAAMVAVALGRDCQRLALVALVGGFLTPILLSTGKDQQVVLFTYLAVLDAGLLALARFRHWRSLEFLSFVATQVYFWGWYSSFYNDEKLGRTAAFATLFFLLFAALPVAGSRRTGTLFQGQGILVLLNAFWFLLALRAMLWPERRWALTLAVLGLAACHLGIAQTAARPKEGETSLVRLLFAGLALTFVTLAIPIRLEGKWITMAWAVEGAVLVWSSLQSRVRFLRHAAAVLFGLVLVRLLFFPIPAERFLLNARFAAFAVAIAAAAFSLLAAKRRPAAVEPEARPFFALLGIGANVLTVWALSLEAWDLFGRQRPAWGLDSELAQQLALSLLWTLYATGLILFGVRRSAVPLRWQGLLLLGLAVAKVFLFDLSFLERVYRIASFLALGVVLLAVSFLYQRSRSLAADKPEEKP